MGQFARWVYFEYGAMTTFLNLKCVRLIRQARMHRIPIMSWTVSADGRKKALI
jgi:hypothetical protein